MRVWYGTCWSAATAFVRSIRSNGSRSETARVFVRSNIARISPSNSSSLIASYGSSRYILLLATATSVESLRWRSAHVWDSVLAGDQPKQRSAIAQLLCDLAPGGYRAPGHISVVTLRISKHLIHVGDRDRSLWVIQRQVHTVEPIPDDRSAFHHVSIYST